MLSVPLLHGLTAGAAAALSSHGAQSSGFLMVKRSTRSSFWVLRASSPHAGRELRERQAGAVAPVPPGSKRRRAGSLALPPLLLAAGVGWLEVPVGPVGDGDQPQAAPEPGAEQSLPSSSPGRKTLCSRPPPPRTADAARVPRLSPERPGLLWEWLTALTLHLLGGQGGRAASRGGTVAVPAVAWRPPGSCPGLPAPSPLLSGEMKQSNYPRG